jgi:hypothetical protein
MSGDEDLFAEMQQQEADEADRIARMVGQKPETKVVDRKPPDPEKALDRYEREVAPVFEARRRVEAGLPPTKNPIRNLVMRLTGNDKLTNRPGFEIVHPSKGLVSMGKSLEEMQAEIAANPKAFRALRKSAVPVQKVEAERKTVNDLRGGREK